jgi:murein DD-endopeptidase MepM/ murein hydrolase activator NlpD
LKRSLASLLLAGSLFVVGVGVLSVSGPLQVRPAAEVLGDAPAEGARNRWETREDSVRSGDLFGGVLRRVGLSDGEVAELVRVPRRFNVGRIATGWRVRARVSPDSGAAEVVVHFGVDRLVRLRRIADRWEESEETLPWETDTVAVVGTVRSHLTGAVVAGAVAFTGKTRALVAKEIADVLEGQLDLSRDLQPGDSLQALVVRERLGDSTRVGAVLATRLHTGGRVLEAIRVEGRDRKAGYYDGKGQPLDAGFLQMPVEYARLSSGFGNRRHPILGTMRRHTGLDYAAAAGTPVRAVGAGTVVFAGFKGGYGRTLEIRHGNGMVTRYAHLKGFGKGIRVGSRVERKQTVAFVGSTGLATGPHLHFEVLVRGVYRDPRTALRGSTGAPLLAVDRGAFESSRGLLLARLEALTPVFAAAGAVPSRVTGD